jgi:hypothetical protein
MKREKMKGRKEDNDSLFECLVISNVHFECTESNGNILFPSLFLVTRPLCSLFILMSDFCTLSIVHYH